MTKFISIFTLASVILASNSLAQTSTQQWDYLNRQNEESDRQLKGKGSTSVYDYDQERNIRETREWLNRTRPNPSNRPSPW